MIAFDRATPIRFASPWGRRLAYALAASLLLHGVLLLPGVNLSSSAQGQRTLRAVLQVAPTADAPPAERLVQAASSAAVRTAASAKSRPAARSPDVAADASLVRAATEAGPVTEIGGIDGEGLRAYRIALAVAARRLRPTVSAAGLTGRVELQVSVDAMGARVSVATSSGQAGLDAAALALMRLAVADAAMPASVRGQVFVVDVPVLFGAGL